MLIIFQASIDYIKYLENCVVKLNEQDCGCRGWNTAGHGSLPSIRGFLASSVMHRELIDEA